MPRPRSLHCPVHPDAPSWRMSRCPDCAALNGREPTPTTSGTTGHQRGHPERQGAPERSPAQHADPGEVGALSARVAALEGEVERLRAALREARREHDDLLCWTPED